MTFSSALNKMFSLIQFQLDSFYYYYFIVFFFLHCTCKNKEIIFREAKVSVNLYCRMIHVSLFLFFYIHFSVESKELNIGGTFGIVFDFVELV